MSSQFVETIGEPAAEATTKSPSCTGKVVAAVFISFIIFGVAIWYHMTYQMYQEFITSDAKTWTVPHSAEYMLVFDAAHTIKIDGTDKPVVAGANILELKKSSVVSSDKAYWVIQQK
jgi:hypothetical protein